jgi:hypothetical protein
MRHPNRPARANRTLLITLGLVVAVAGAFALLTSYGVLSSYGLPTSGFDPHRPVITRTATPADWVPYVVTVVAILLGLLCLWFLARQARTRPKNRTWRLSGNTETGYTRLHAGTAIEPLLLELEDYPGVVAAAAWLSGGLDRPALFVRLRTDHQADLPALREEIHNQAIPRLRATLDLDELPTDILVEPTTSHVRAQ